jgi:TPR repeat protein
MSRSASVAVVCALALPAAGSAAESDWASGRQAECTRGELEACIAIGTALTDGTHGLRRDPERAAQLFGKACDGGDPLGCSRLGLAHLAGAGVPQDLELAASLVRFACYNNEYSACTEMDRMLAQHGSEIEAAQREAVDRHGKGCAAGNAEDCYRLGLLLEYGQGTPRDLDRAGSFYRVACEAHHGLACYRLAHYLGHYRDPPDLVGAAARYDDACASPARRGCHNLAMMLRDGDGIPKDPARAVTLSRRACEGTEPLSCQLLSFSTRDPARARALLERGCSSGNNGACCALTRKAAPATVRATRVAGQYLDARGHDIFYSCVEEGRAAQTGHNRSTDLAEAQADFQFACDAHEPTGCLEVSRLLTRDGASAADRQRARTLLESACTDHMMAACVALGGLLVADSPANTPRARELNQRACDANEASGCLVDGLLWWEGKSVDKDRPRAVKQFDRACTLGSAGGCTLLGMAYEMGDGVPRDQARAEAFFRRGCDGDEPLGCVRLGLSWLGTRPEDAAHLFQAACQLKNPGGCYALGMAHLRGLGVPRDVAKARALLRRSCDMGYAEACSSGATLPP